MNHKLKLVSFHSTDNLVLPGLLYEPEKKTDKAVVYLHGNGTSSIFYSPEKMNLFGKEINSIGISFFPFNNRGAHWIKKLDKKDDSRVERIFYGMTYELIKEAIFDIDGAINYLKSLGYKEFYLAGVSTGANKIVVYNYYRNNNQVSKYILISGGDDVGLYFDFYFKKNKKLFFKILKKSQEMIKEGKGRHIVPFSLISDPMISYQSLYDTINPDSDYNIFPYHEEILNIKLGTKTPFREYKKINKRTLIIYGGQDEYSYGDVERCVSILKKQNNNSSLFTYKIIPNADHGYSGKEKELIKTIVGWLSG